MKRTFAKLSANRWLLWGSFGAGFLLPYAFLIFLCLATASAWRAFTTEYEDVGVYWRKASKKSLEEIRASCSEAVTRQTPLSVRLAT
ncbi:hypothetical protein [Hydrogenimonas cancrithermarum]|uniref:Uncharacterized protein n=1 Tax=Hydrogenimonas cancrithermarum TaxID=2993563 RepID=A0ABM8FNM3_9BACT|nr:hypothetical protein [Hydrogenimonas cancrithermarum]BDY13187.1 hypothetical protein HCR_14990 [Hydrogenimonas cancrithermarum]